MLITFLRHATAEEHRLGHPDAERALTDKGEKQVKRVALFCLANDLIPINLYCSPLVRAQQTASLLQKRIGIGRLPHIVDWLAIEQSPADFIQNLARLDQQGLDDVWLVGHEPDFSAVISELLHCSTDSIAIKKASLTRLQVDFNEDEPEACLLWSIPCGFMP